MQALCRVSPLSGFALEIGFPPQNRPAPPALAAGALGSSKGFRPARSPRRFFDSLRAAKERLFAGSWEACKSIAATDGMTSPREKGQRSQNSCLAVQSVLPCCFTSLCRALLLPAFREEPKKERGSSDDSNPVNFQRAARPVYRPYDLIVPSAKRMAAL